MGLQRVYKVLLCLRLRQRPASIELAVLGAQGFHLGFVEGDEAHKEPQKRKNDGFGKGLVRENACCEKEASDEGDEVFHLSTSGISISSPSLEAT